MKLVQPDAGLVIMDISKYVGPGVNTARLVAAHEMSKISKTSKSIEDTLEIVIGKGVVKKDAVVIRKAYVEYTRNSAETRDFDDEFKVFFVCKKAANINSSRIFNDLNDAEI